MRMEIRGRNIEITDALKDYTTKRLAKLDKYLDEARIAQVALSVEGEKHKEMHKVEVTIPLNLNNLLLRGEVSADNMYAAIDLVVEKLDKQIEKHKTKIYKKHRGVGLKALAAEEMAALTAAQPSGKENNAEKYKIVRTKRFELHPMDEQEAIMQMGLLGHNFFMFYNANTGNINVVYKRTDGNYGLIEPR
ncbi:MAG: ribosome-associated translation inhibitor RaiA [Syntrophomonadaceae bacterium]|nr:ribosome-associated translation inhibitor RaiA [Syntrophomonadaceae bacterium]